MTWNGLKEGTAARKSANHKNKEPTQLTFTYSKWTLETLEKGAKYVQSSSYTNADMKICQYLRLYIKNYMPNVSLLPITFWYMRTRDAWNVCLQTYINNRIYLKLA